MLSLHFGGIRDDYADPSPAGTTPELSFLAGGGGNAQIFLLRTEPELSFNFDLVSAEELILPGARLQSSPKSTLAARSPKEIVSEIFIPPRSIS